MTASIGIDLPPRTKPGKLGDRWLGVVPIAQGAVIGDVLVQLIALERRSAGAVLTARMSRLEELILTEPSEHLPWPKLRLTAQDDVGSTYRVGNGAGRGSQSDWDVEYGVVGAIHDDARRLDLTITELYWEVLSNGTIEGRMTGAWPFPIDLSREVPARMV